MRIDPLTCPECGEDVEGIVFQVEALAQVNVFDDNTAEWSGSTEYGDIGAAKGLRLVQCEKRHRYYARIEE